MDTVKFSGKKGSLFLALFRGSLGLVIALLLPFLLSPGTTRTLTFIFTIGFVGFFGGRKVLRIFKQLLHSNEVIVLDEKGLTDRSYGLGFIPWSNIKNVQPKNHTRSVLGVNQSFQLLEIELYDEASYFNNNSSLNKTLIKFGQNQHSGLWLNTENLTVSSDEVLKKITQFINRK